MTPSAPPASAVTIPIRKPPNAVAKNTAGKYGVKNTSGRISESAHRAAVDKSKAECCKSDAEKRRGLGYSVPASPELVDQFRHGPITSADQQIQNKAEHRRKHARPGSAR